MADYGEDYEPTDLGHLLKSEFTLNTKLSPEMKVHIKRFYNCIRKSKATRELQRNRTVRSGTALLFCIALVHWIDISTSQSVI